MTRRLAAALIVAATFFGPGALAQDRFPEFTNYVVDEAGVVPDEVEQRINAALKDYEDRSSNQIAVAVVETVGNRSLEDYSIDLAREWGVGTKGDDNGVLFFVAYEDRQLRIEVGRGLEDELTDLESGRIIRNQVVPRLREGDVGGAIETGVNEIRRALGDDQVGEPPPLPQPAEDGSDRGHGLARALPLLLILPLVFGWRARSLRARTSPVFWGGGAAGRRRRRDVRSGRRRNDDEDDDGGGLLGAALLGSLLLGGGRGGGWDGGGGGDFGGFGGGGGGDFGGGGASGDW